MSSKLRKFIYILCLVQIIHISLCRILLSKEEENAENSLAKCIISIFHNYAYPTETISIMLNENSTNRILLTTIHNEKQWSIFNSLSKHINPETDTLETFYKIKNYLLQIPDENEIETILELLQNKWWNSAAELVVFTNNNFGNKAHVYDLLFKTLWNIQLLNSIVITPEEGSSTTFNFYSWFPYWNGSCGGYKNYILLDTCTNGVFKIGRNLFPDKVPNNLQGCPVRVRTVIWPPYTIAPEKLQPQQTTINFTEGLDIVLLNTIANAANFNIVYTISERIEDWGITFDNGSSTGILGALSKEEVDMGIGDLGPTINRFKYFEASVSYASDSIIWCVPSASLKPTWLNVFNIYELNTYLFIVITFLILCVFTNMLSRIIHDIQGYRDVSNCFLHMYGVLLGISVLKPFYSSSRIIFFMCAILNLILAAVYQTSLISFLTNPSYEKQITTVQEMLEHKLEILSFLETGLYFVDDNDWTIQQMMSELKVCEDTQACLYKVAHERNAALTMTFLYLLYDMANLIEDDGRLMVYWFKDSIITTPIHIFMNKGFPLKHKIDFYIHQITQSGLHDKWVEDMMHQIKKKNSAISSSEDEEDEPELLTLDQLQGAFLILLIGLTIALLAFIIEMIVFRRTKKKNCQWNRHKRQRHRQLTV